MDEKRGFNRIEHPNSLHGIDLHEKPQEGKGERHADSPEPERPTIPRNDAGPKAGAGKAKHSPN